MFSTLKMRLKIHIKRFIYDLVKTHYEIQNWTQTITCVTCNHQVAQDAQYCPKCGHPTVVHNTVQRPFPTSSNFKLQNTDPVLIKPVTILAPSPSVTRCFLSYVRNTKKKVGPDTIRHRTQQDQEGTLFPFMPPSLIPSTPIPYEGINISRDTSKTNIRIPGDHSF